MPNTEHHTDRSAGQAPGPTPWGRDTCAVIGSEMPTEHMTQKSSIHPTPTKGLSFKHSRVTLLDVLPPVHPCVRNSKLRIHNQMKHFCIY